MGRKVAATVFVMAIYAPAFADPLAEFEQKVGACKAAYDARPNPEVIYAEPAKSWVKRLFGPAEVTFDVRKTDSLVSPFSAFLRMVQVVQAERADDEAAAQRLEFSPGGAAIRTDLRLNFAYQGGKWVLVGGTSTSAFRRNGDASFDRPRSLDISVEAIEKMPMPVPRCS